MPKPLKDIETTLRRIAECAVKISGIRKNIGGNTSLAHVRANLHGKSHISFSMNGLKHTPGLTARINNHDMIQSEALEREAHTLVPILIDQLRALSPGFNTPRLPVEVEIGQPSKRQPRIHMKIYGRSFTTTTDPLELPRVLAALSDVLSYLDGVSPGGTRHFMIDRCPTLILAHDPVSALRIHAALGSRRLFEGGHPHPQIMESMCAQVPAGALSSPVGAGTITVA